MAFKDSMIECPLPIVNEPESPDSDQHPFWVVYWSSPRSRPSLLTAIFVFHKRYSPEHFHFKAYYEEGGRNVVTTGLNLRPWKIRFVRSGIPQTEDIFCRNEEEVVAEFVALKLTYGL